MSEPESIERRELVRIVDEASAHITTNTRAKLLEVAATTDAVAVGWFHCDGVGCPARQAGCSNQDFQRAFDEAMAARFGWHAHRGDAFVVRVTGGTSHMFEDLGVKLTEER